MSSQLRRLKMFVASLEEVEAEKPTEGDAASTADTAVPVAEDGTAAAEPVAAIDGELPKGEPSAAPIVEGAVEATVVDVAATATAVTEVAPAPEVAVPAATEDKTPELSAEPKAEGGPAVPTEAPVLSVEEGEIGAVDPVEPLVVEDVPAAVDPAPVAAEPVVEGGEVADGVVEVDVEVIADAEAAIQAVVDADGEVDAANVDVDTLQDIANQLQETLTVANESLVDGVMPAYTQKFMAVSLRAAYRRIGLEDDSTDATGPELPVAEEPKVEENAEGGGPGVPVTDVVQAAGVDEVPVDVDNDSSQPTVAEDTVAELVFEGTASTEAFADQVKAFWATLVKALKAAWAKVVAFFETVFSATASVEKALDIAEARVKNSKGADTATVSVNASAFTAGAKLQSALLTALKTATNQDPSKGAGKDVGASENVWTGGGSVSKAELLTIIGAAKKYVASVVANKAAVKEVTASVKKIDTLFSRIVSQLSVDYEKDDLTAHRKTVREYFAALQENQSALTRNIRIGLSHAKSVANASKTYSPSAAK